MFTPSFYDKKIGLLFLLTEITTFNGICFTKGTTYRLKGIIYIFYINNKKTIKVYYLSQFFMLKLFILEYSQFPIILYFTFIFSYTLS